MLTVANSSRSTWRNCEIRQMYRGKKESEKDRERDEMPVFFHSESAALFALGSDGQAHISEHRQKRQKDCSCIRLKALCAAFRLSLNAVSKHATANATHSERETACGTAIIGHIIH